MMDKVVAIAIVIGVVSAVGVAIALIRILT
jgi:hypothetical protein